MTWLCCVLSPLLYCLYIYDRRLAHRNNIIVKFADDTTAAGLVSKGDEAAYREEVQKLTAWCSGNNRELNTAKIKGVTKWITTQCLSRAQKITKDNFHPGFQLFELLASRRCYRCLLRTKINRLRNSSFPRAITTLTPFYIYTF